MIVRELLAKLGVQVDGASFVKAGAALASLAAGYKLIKSIAEDAADVLGADRNLVTPERIH